MIEHKGYLAAAEVDFESGLLRGRVINVRDEITFEGATPEELEQEFREAVDEYLEEYDDSGEAAAEPFDGYVSAEVSAEVHEQIIKAADARGMTVEAWVAAVLSGVVLGASTNSPAASSSAPEPKGEGLTGRPSSIFETLLAGD